jgi:CheY-like chemotaxis protein
VRIELDEDCAIHGDIDQLRQVAMNLVTNAGQAVEAGSDGEGVLDVRVSSVQVDQDWAAQYADLDPGRYVLLAVSDTGPGMDAQTQERIFDPFFTTKESGKKKGTGLGLSVVHGIVEGMNGTITVYSEPGEGTTFNVYIPRASEETTSEEGQEVMANTISRGSEVAISDIEERGGHVLVVDDDPAVTDLESTRLPRLGCEVTICHQVDEALDVAIARSDQIDLVLTDYQMPGRTGLDFAQTLQDQGIRIPIVMMSGFQAQVSQVRARESGVSVVLPKPIDLATLRRVIAEFAWDDA